MAQINEFALIFSEYRVVKTRIKTLSAGVIS